MQVSDEERTRIWIWNHTRPSNELQLKRYMWYKTSCHLEEIELNRTQSLQKVDSCSSCCIDYFRLLFSFTENFLYYTKYILYIRCYILY